MSNYCKSYFILVICTLIVYTQQQLKDPKFMEKYAQDSSACAKENDLAEDYVTKIWNDNHFPNDPKLKCYFKCMCVKLGILTQDGKIVIESLKAVQTQFTDAATEKEQEVECGGISGTDLCDTAYKLAGCIKAAELD